MTPIGAVVVAGCLAVGADRDTIVANDLGLASDVVVGLAPAPGVVRRFDVAELRRIADRLGLPAPEHEVCVTRPVAPPDPARILEAMRASLPGARIELLDYSRFPTPEGALEFPIGGLHGEIWRGFVRYGGRHRAAVWAKVKATAPAARVLAAADLRAGQPIDAASLAVETRDEFPSAEPFAATVEQVAGKVSRRSIRAGTAIRSDWLTEPNAVERGETVQVEVREGGAVLQLIGEAQRAGTVGQTIPVRNPTSKAIFKGRVEGKGKVTVGGTR
jgi:flagella basal body P-ring formation protein FlgA